MEKQLRKCRDCGLEAYTKDDLELFSKNKKCKYGRDNLCKKCMIKKQKKYNIENAEKIRERDRKYRETNREKIYIRQRKYREAHREEIKEYQKRWREENRERRRERARQYNKANPGKSKKWRKKNPFAASLTRMKRRAKDIGVDFDLDIDYLKQLWDECGGVCQKTGVIMKMITEGYDPFSNSVDRIIPDKGYIKGNVRFTCRWYNTARSNLGDKFTLEMCQRVVERARNNK